MSQTAEYCQSCGVAITEPSAFCGSCGAALAEPSPPDAQAFTSAVPKPPTSRPSGARPAMAATGAPGVPPAATPVDQAPPPPAAAPQGAPSQAGSQPPTGSRSWIPFAAVGGAAVLVAAVVAILLLTLGGSAGKNLESTSVTRQQALQLLADSGTTTVSSAAPGLFALVSSGKLTAIVPAGWRATAQAASGTTRAEFTDPRYAGSSLTIVAQGARGGNAHDQAGTALKAVRKTGDTVNSYGPVNFPGGREAWQVTYTDAGLTDETYFFSACNGKAAMVVAVQASTVIFHREQTTLEAVAASAEPLCS
jgi:hypothetical protein